MRPETIRHRLIPLLLVGAFGLTLSVLSLLDRAELARIDPSPAPPQIVLLGR